MLPLSDSFENTFGKIRVFGGKNVSYGGDNSTFEFIGTYDGQQYSLYDYKNDRNVHIGGGAKLNVSGLKTFLLKQLDEIKTFEPFFAADEDDDDY